MRKIFIYALLAGLIAVFPNVHSLFAQTDDETLAATILKRDSLFWLSYNTCDTAGNKQFFTSDVEFYHDKGGLTSGAENLSASMKKNLCGANTFRLRREAVEGSVHVFPLRNAEGIYGAILSGEHVFYIIEKEKGEHLDGRANFTHVWVRQNNVWKMSRILSYDHRPATYSNKRNEIKLSDATLARFAGKYKGAQSGTLQIQKGQGALILISNDKKSVLYPETENRFFTKERDLTFEFVLNEKHEVSKMLVREGGELAETLEAAK